MDGQGVAKDTERARGYFEKAGFDPDEFMQG
jgi:hypothetical protein